MCHSNRTWQNLKSNSVNQKNIFFFSNVYFYDERMSTNHMNFFHLPVKILYIETHWRYKILFSFCVQLKLDFSKNGSLHRKEMQCRCMCIVVQTTFINILSTFRLGWKCTQWEYWQKSKTLLVYSILSHFPCLF